MTNRNHPPAQRAAALASVGAGLIALAGAAAWWLDHWRPAGLGPDYIPMAPSTALLFFWLSAAVFLHTTRSPEFSARAIETACVLLVLAGGLLIEAQFLFGFTLPFEQWLSRTNETIGKIPVGRMSSLTAGCFLLEALALLCSRVTAPRWEPVRSLGGWLALTVLLASGIIVASYAAGTPLFYGGAAIPMALLTSVAFVLVSAATLLARGEEAWPLRMFSRRGAESHGGSRAGIEWPLLFLFVLVASSIAVAGMRFLKNQQDRTRLGAHAELEAIADLKVQQIANWRSERLGDGRFFSQASFVARDIAQFLAAPADPSVERELQHWLALLKGGDRYARVAIFDTQLNLRLSIPPWTNGPGPEVRASLAEALRANDVRLTDLHWNTASNEIHMELMIPVRPAVLGPNGAANTNAPFAAILLYIHPRDFLFPLILHWPTPSPSGETLLVRREGNSVVYMNDLRHLPGSALALRRSMDEVGLPAAIGLRGDIGIHNGVDYRGVAVVAASRRVPDTPWVMIAKVDEAELYAPLRRQAISVTAVMLSLFLAAAFGINVLWRRRKEHLLEGQLATEQERRALAERFEHLMKHASDAILLADEQWRILEANDCAAQIYGWTTAELQRLTIPDLRAPEARGAFPGQMQALREHDSVLFETTHQRKDGSVFPVEVSARMIKIGGTPLKLAMIRDITQRKAHEAEIERLNRLYATLSEVNQTIVHCQSREELFLRICRVAVEFGRFQATWIGWKTPGEKALTPVAHFVSSLDAVAAGPLPGMENSSGVAAEAVRTGRASFCNEAPTDPCVACCRKRLASMGIQSCASFPLRLRGEVCGVFSIGSRESGFFKASELQLLEEIADDISFALDKLDKEELRRQADEALRDSEARLRLFTRHAPAALAMFDREMRYLAVSRRWLTDYRLDERNVIGTSHYELFPQIPEHWKAIHRRGLAGEVVRADEDCFQRPDGNVQWLHWEVRPWRAADGSVGGIVIFSEDITQAKQAQEQVRKLSRAVEQSPAAVIITDLSGNIEYVNATFNSLTGYTLEEVRGRNPRLLKSGETPMEVYRQLWETIRAGGEWRGEFHNRKKNGELYWEYASIFPIVDEAGKITHFMGIKENITARKHLEAQHAAMEAQLRQQQKLESIGTLAGGVAHEINNPINGIMNYAQLIQDGLGPGHRLTEYTGEILHETHRVAAIVHNLLTFARTEKQSHSLARPQDIIEGTLSLIRTVIRRDHITLAVDVAEDLPEIKCRTQQIQQVLLNLMTNARDALNGRYPNPDPDKLMRLTARLIEKAGRRWIRFTVEDHGTGITPEVRERMFDPFFTTKPRDVGTGLGLSISHGIVKEHHGEWTVETEPGRFTSMHVDLPVDNGWEL